MLYNPLGSLFSSGFTGDGAIDQFIYLSCSPKANGEIERLEHMLIGKLNQAVCMSIS